MTDTQEVDVEQLMGLIRETMHKRQQELSPLQSSAPAQNTTVSSDLISLRGDLDVYHVHFTSHRRVFGSFVVFAKKTLRRLLTPILAKQVSYNAANMRLVTYLLEQYGTLSQQLAQRQAELATVLELRPAQWREILQEHQHQVLQTLETRLAQVQTELQAQQTHTLETRLAQVQTELQAQQTHALEVLQERLTMFERTQTQALQTLRERVARTERNVRRLLYTLTDNQGAEHEARTQLQKVPRHSLVPDFDYFGFEERFRGGEEDIKERQRAYVEYFRGHGESLDLGCGRGEFLELLREAGIKARGVDSDLDMILHCREKGLDVVQEDAFVCLATLAEESVGGIFAAQIIEHLEPSRVIELVRLCYQKLRPGSVLILETPNPTCLMVFAASFYMDFSHIRPLHPEAMKFLLEAEGFQQVEVRYANPVDDAMRLSSPSDLGLSQETQEAFTRSIAKLNDLLYGFQDYAVIGRKPLVQRGGNHLPVAFAERPAQ